jgi:hypothetical protein
VIDERPYGELDRAAALGDGSFLIYSQEAGMLEHLAADGSLIDLVEFPRREVNIVNPMGTPMTAYTVDHLSSLVVDDAGREWLMDENPAALVRVRL